MKRGATLSESLRRAFFVSPSRYLAEKYLQPNLTHTKNTIC
ncbi:MAG: hypothetical protein RI894_544 [Bacteroidota bacterium]|jgi:hypothetical protein